jgi:hypothetical protein
MYRFHERHQYTLSPNNKFNSPEDSTGSDLKSTPGEQVYKGPDFFLITRYGKHLYQDA